MKMNKMKSSLHSIRLTLYIFFSYCVNTVSLRRVFILLINDKLSQWWDCYFSSVNLLFGDFLFSVISHQKVCLTMICLSVCDHQLIIFFLQVKARLGQAWQAINKVSASEGVSFKFYL